ncbi:putative RNA-directed DNA polymerase like protein [Argiope bruennichi]|uniref:Putative RNA-directed DNA polymerase like protein n=1 Tax=Argiope bruennichi TaxID=94029 RepID=A0A8T0F7Z5_ARGBR|nr:putative RNA-directed DNA polymerase like protein [Argiope bruennichi]
MIKQSKLVGQNDTFPTNSHRKNLTVQSKTLTPPKSPDIDLVYGHMVKHFGVFARLTFLRISNLSRNTDKLPTTWKKSIIVPILKSGKDASYCNNYHSISLTSTLCKLIEKIVHTRIMTRLIKQNVLHSYQIAYRAQYTARSTNFSIWSNQSLMDFKTNPTRRQLQFSSISRQPLIVERKFVVRVNGKFSKTHRLSAGVPQGSVLRPLLFLLYMNTIHGHIGNRVKIACYADDIAIWHTHSDIKTSENALNINLANIEAWALQLMINSEKSNLCIFTTDRKNRKAFQSNIKIFNSAIKQVASSYPKYLGLTLDIELRFTKHIETISHRA